MKILAIGAHADDVELGCGGSLLKWAAAGHEITIFTATDSAYAAPDGTVIRSAETARTEAEAAAKKIGARLITGDFKTFALTFSEPLNAGLIEVIGEVGPDMVLTHWSGDSHPDHQALASATLHACRRVPTVLTYASNGYPGFTTFDGRTHVDISDVLEDKLALVSLFDSENTRTDGAWVDSLRDHAAVCGRITGVDHAESFGVVKQRFHL